MAQFQLLLEGIVVTTVSDQLTVSDQKNGRGKTDLLILGNHGSTSVHPYIQVF